MTHSRNEDASRTAKDEQQPPPSLFRKLGDRFHFNVDIASAQLYDNEGEAFDTNALCDRYVYVSANNNGFLDSTLHLTEKEVAYCNPPYSRGNIDKFIKKAYEESLKWGGDNAIQRKQTRNSGYDCEQENREPDSNQDELVSQEREEGYATGRIFQWGSRGTG